MTRKKAIAQGWVDQPSQNRWHTNSTALFGGIAITLSLLPGWIFASIVPAQPAFTPFPIDTLYVQPSFIILFCGIAILFSMGVVDDYRGVQPRTKLLLQIIAAIFVLLSGHRLHWCSVQLIDMLLTLLWIITITNAFNLIDNMDGLCIGISLIASLHFLFWLYHPFPQAAFLASALVGVSAGFLVFNFNPAKIFMGDSGSHVLGFIFSIFAIFFSEHISDSLMVSISGPLLILIIPVFDILFVTINRMREGRSIFIGGCDHTSHKLVCLGYSEKGSVLLLYCIALIAGLAVVLLTLSNHNFGVFILLFCAALSCFCGWVLSKTQCNQRELG